VRFFYVHRPAHSHSGLGAAWEVIDDVVGQGAEVEGDGHTVHPDGASHLHADTSVMMMMMMMMGRMMMMRR
jgi:hypothetical protein